MIDEAFYRARALEICDIAVNFTKGRLREDPIVQDITQGQHGSSCGFLPHFVFYMLGVRENWINREDVGGYRDRQNLSLLFGALWKANGPKCVRRIVRSDVLLHGNVVDMEDPRKEHDDHVCIVAKDYEGGDEFLSYDYGQRGAGGEQEDARFCSRKVYRNSSNRTTVRGGKELAIMLDLVEVIAEAKKNGNLVDPVDLSEWLNRVRGQDGS